ncbi:MAG: aspartate aminotransferase family protein [Ignavibacteriaceae bacterium]
MSNQKQLQFETASALLKNYSRYEVEFERGEGAYLYDTNGKKYLDLLSGIAVTGFGHNHPKITNAVKEQAEKLFHVSNLFQSSHQEILAEKLVNSSGLDNVFFCNSGTEANEGAIKFARKWGQGRFSIITAVGGFHGRTMGSLSASAQYKLWDGFAPLTPGFSYVPFNDIEAIENSIDDNTVAVMLEPIQGESGVNVPSDNYLYEVRELCSKYNLLLIIDEVQTGMGRTGKMFAYQWENIKPDIITIAKGIANGLPLGAVVCTKEVGDFMTPGSHGSTFGGNPLAIASANVVMDLLNNECLDKNNSLGEKLKEEIFSLANENIKSVRGKGLIIGVELKGKLSAKKGASELLNAGIVAGTAGDNVLRLLPPFVITENEIELFIKEFSYIINKLQDSNVS